MRNIVTRVKASLPRVFTVLINSTLLAVLGYAIFVGGFSIGYRKGSGDTVALVSQELESFPKREMSQKEYIHEEKPATPPLTATAAPRPKAIAWTGPELWEKVNERRLENGVNSLGQRDEICTIASLRLNELLELGKLDGHEGFSTLPDRRPDLEWIYERYNLTEFLLSGAESPEEAVSLWENTLGHKKLLTGGEYVWGCIYAQNSFAVAITAY